MQISALDLAVKIVYLIDGEIGGDGPPRTCGEPEARGRQDRGEERAFY